MVFLIAFLIVLLFHLSVLILRIFKFSGAAFFTNDKNAGHFDGLLPL